MKEIALQLTKHAKRLNNRLSVAQQCTGCNLMHSYFSAHYKVLKQRVDPM